MKRIVHNRPPMEVRCSNCNSVYNIEQEDVTVEIDTLCGKVNAGAPDLLAVWTCPVCSTVTSKWMYELPSEWRAEIKDRGGIK